MTDPDFIILYVDSPATSAGFYTDILGNQVDIGNRFCPFRRDVPWVKANEMPIQPLLNTLEFSGGNRNWRYQLRFGIFKISQHDMSVIAIQMGAEF